MGCGASSQKVDGNNAGANGKYEDRGANGKKEALQGKDRYLADIGAAAHVIEDKGRQTGIFLISVDGDDKIVFAYKNLKTSAIYVAEFTDDEFNEKKTSSSITHSFNAIFKSLATEVIKGKVKLSVSDAIVSTTFSITSQKDPKNIQILPISLNAAPSQTPVTNVKYIVGPMMRMVQKRRLSTEEQEKELKVSRLHMQDVLSAANVVQHRATIDRIKQTIVPLREEAATHSKTSNELSTRIASLERRIRKLKLGTINKNSLDGIYDEGGARHFNHLPEAEEHIPHMREGSNEALLEWIKMALPGAEGDALAQIARPPSDPRVAGLLDSADGRLAANVMQLFTKLDSWDMSVFEIEKNTGNMALYYTTFAMLSKLNLINDLKINERILRNFLAAVQAGYHPNEYHNATHAADVAQINYFILTKGGLIEKCKLSKHEVFAAVIAGAIHDYDHPGFNNNFHTRTNAYLSTLYNDRSILENHHLACVYEIMRLPQYDICSGMTDDERREVRDTMIEMVLSTDMGNHAKIFGQFRKRLNEGGDWNERKEDVRLALSMSIKMADISNCGRPQFLYLEWAKNIANEFYNQGDHELRSGLSISPFMDRRKDRTDFPKGQISFMNFVVVPMFEAVSELFPAVEVALQHCTENKEYWQHMD